MRGGDVEVELRHRSGEFVEEARPVKAADLDDGVDIRPLVVDRNLRLDGECLDLAAAGGSGAPTDNLRQLEFADQRLLDGIGDA